MNKESWVPIEKTKCSNNVKKFSFTNKSIEACKELDMEVIYVRNIQDSHVVK